MSSRRLVAALAALSLSSSCTYSTSPPMQKSEVTYAPVTGVTNAFPSEQPASPPPPEAKRAPVNAPKVALQRARISTGLLSQKPASEGKRGQKEVVDFNFTDSRIEGQLAMPDGNAVVARPPPPPKIPAAQVASGESYQDYGVNRMTDASQDHLSTFAIDVDTASYTIARRKLLEGTLPPPEAVRVEEFLNYFRYSYPSPETAPFAVHMDAAPSPFSRGRTLLRVGLQGRKVSLRERKFAHLTFLVDVSGSMSSPDRLPLAKKALRVLVDNLKDGDTVALVTYAGAVKEVLPPTGLERKAQIHAAIEALDASGSTAMSSGLELAYKNAAKTLSPDSISRVLVLSDGDANVGNTSYEQILKTIAGHVQEGVTLSTVGFGSGNYKDQLMEQLADKGNGNYFYIDSMMQARRVFQEQLGGTLEVIAQDVKVQVDFNQQAVKRYRLIGYENRDLRDQDFRDDRVDAGEIGAGHSVTALYEVELAEGAGTQSLATVRVRAKKPRGEKAEESAFVFRREAIASSFDEAPADLRFATAVMASAEIFRKSPYAREWSLDAVLRIARAATPESSAERREFCELLAKAREIKGLSSHVATR